VTTINRDQLAKLAKRIDPGFIRNTRDDGKGEDYAPHHAINQLLLLILGPFSFELVQIHRGDVLTRNKEQGKPSFSDEHSTIVLRNVVVGATYRLTATVDGQREVIEQTGDVEHAELWQHDGARLKDAESDAIKRCAMRLGLGLHLWADQGYVLDRWLPVSSKDEGAETSGAGRGGPAPDPTSAPAGPGETGPAGEDTTQPKQQRTSRARSTKAKDSPAEPAAPQAAPTAEEGAPAAAPTAPGPAAAGATTNGQAHPADQATTMEQVAVALGRSLNNCWIRLRRAGQNDETFARFTGLADAKALKGLSGEDFELARAWLIDHNGKAAA